MQAVILAGGKGTRLRPFTRLQPKPLLPLLEVPFLEWMIQRCQHVGLTDIVISVGYLGHHIEDHLRTGEDWDVQIRYIHEEKPLDTAGALTLARPFFTGEPLVIFNADILTDLDLRQLMNHHHASQATTTLTLTRVDDITAYGLVETAPTGVIVSFREKPTAAEAAEITTDTINAGTYVMDPHVFDPYPEGEPLSFERQVFPDILKAESKMMAYIHEGYWRDLGKPPSYYQGQLDILKGNIPGFPLSGVQEHSAGLWIHSEADIDPEAHLEAPCYIGAYTKIGSQAWIPSGTIVGGQCWINGPLKPGVYAPGTLISSE